MKKILVYAMAIVTVLMAIQCSPKTSKSTAASSEKTNSNASSQPTSVETPKPTNEPTTPAATKPIETKPVDDGLAMKERLKDGKQIFSTSCKKCHALYEPSSRTAQEWKPILVVMTAKANLSTVETSKVADYIYSTCKK
jgi:cytochrome c5